jgi:hypothetical protein
MGEWQNFVSDVRAYYDVDMAAITKDYEQEQLEYLLQTACWSDVHPGNLLGQTSVIKPMDLATVSLDEVKAPIKSSFSMLVTRQGPISGLAGFFDTCFKGSQDNPLENEVCAALLAPTKVGALKRAPQLSESNFVCQIKRIRCSMARTFAHYSGSGVWHLRRQ